MVSGITRSRLGWILALGVVLLPTVALSWLLGTQSGAEAGVRYALKKSGLDATFGGLDGTLAGGFVINDVQAKMDSAELALGHLEVSPALSDLLRGRITLERLVAENGRLVLTDNANATPARDQPMQLPVAIDLPVDVSIQHLEVRRSKVIASDTTELVDLSSIRASVRLEGRELTVTDGSAQSSLGTAAVKASLMLEQPYRIALEAGTELAPPDMPTLSSVTRLRGSLESLTIEHTSSPPYNLSLSGSIEPLAVTPAIDLTLRFDEVPLAEIVEDAASNLTPSGHVQAQGALNNLTLEAEFEARVPDLGHVDARLNGRLTPSELTLEASTVTLETESGNTTFKPAGVIAFEQGEPDVDMMVAIDQIALPVNDKALLSFGQTSMRLVGTPRSYTVTAAGQIHSQLEEGGEFSLSARGTERDLNLEKLAISALEGTLSASGYVHFESGWRFNVDVVGDGLNPAGLNALWPGRVSLEGAVTGSRLSDRLAVRVDQLKMNGTLRDYPVSLQADVAVQGQRLNIETLDLVSGATTLYAKGVIEDDLALSWRVDSTGLASLWPGLTGELYAQGQLDGTRLHPRLVADVRGKELGLDDYRIGSVTATVTPGSNTELDETRSGMVAADLMNPDEWQHRLLTLVGSIELAADDIELGTYRAESLTVKANGTADDHAFTVDLRDELGQTTLNAQGSAQGETYEVTVDELTLRTEAVGRWELDRAVTARIVGERVELPSACVRQEASSLCAGLTRTAGTVDTNLQVNALPLSLLSHWLPTDTRASGVVNGGGELRVSTGVRSEGALKFDIDGLAVQSRFGKESRTSKLAFAPSRVSAEAESTGALVIRAQLPLETGGGFDLSANLGQGVDDGAANRPLTGQLDVALPDVAFLADFVPQLGRAEGRLEGTVDVSGTVKAPQLLGELTLSDGLVTFVEPGVQADNVSLTLTGKPNNRFSIRGSAFSGGGTLELVGEARRTESGLEGDLTLKGDAVQVLNTTESQVWATPDVLATLRNQEISLSGTVQIPRANVQVDALPKGAVRVSPDQVIVGEAPAEKDEVFTYSVDLDLALGDDVQLTAFGLDARLTGRLNVKEQSNKPGSASGEIQLKDGKYEAYGQVLTITTGNLIYAGGALDKPGIDFRAVRKPTPEIEVGIAARGTLDQPGFSVFSTPSMSESDQLAYLVFGRPLNADATSENTLITRLALSLGMQGGEALSQKLANELGVDQVAIESQGSGELSQASLVIGKYLSPKLFVSYGIGLLEPVSTLKLEYALSSKWQLITESSSTRNSADAQYVFER